MSVKRLTGVSIKEPSFKQLMAADVQLFTELADRTRAQPNAAGRPSDEDPQGLHVPPRGELADAT